MEGVVSYVCDDVDLECEGEHVGVETGLGELGGLLRGLGLLEDGLERLQGVLDLDDRGVVDGVRHCGGVRRSGFVFVAVVVVVGLVRGCLEKRNGILWHRGAGSTIYHYRGKQGHTDRLMSPA
jgi:hypothetical protein